MANVLISQRIKGVMDESTEKEEIVLLTGYRDYGKSYLQKLIMLKKWPEGTVCTIGRDGIRVSELADAKLIDENLNEKEILNEKE